MDRCFMVGLVLIVAVYAGKPTTIQPPSVRVEFGETIRIPCRLETKDDISWERRPYNNRSWELLPETGKTLTLDRVNETAIGIYRCRDPSNQTACEIGLRVYRIPYPRLFAIPESKKNVILMVEGILLLACVIIPGAILLREKSQKSLREQLERYKEENVYQGLNQEDQSIYEDITRGQQSLYQDVGNCREGGIELEKP